MVTLVPPSGCAKVTVRFISPANAVGLDVHRAVLLTGRNAFEIVETLVRGPLPLAAEVSGDRLFLFSERALDLLDPATWERLLGTATDLAARLSGTDGTGVPGTAPGTR